jgi:hypothetical protein
MTIRQWLHRRARNPQQNFALLLIGFALFALGILLIGIAQYALTAGLLAELIALSGLLLIGTGILVATLGYLSLSLLRIISFLDDKHE